MSKEWDAFLDDFQQTRWISSSVPAEEQAELKAIVNSTRSDIMSSAPRLGQPRTRKTPKRSHRGVHTIWALTALAGPIR